ncbi:hypothetical protein K439DRAFT_1420638 [Ramaria rubella]|nr:hypothetical protein K439DRAFT_1420638 [Ramaria rubella]
MDRTKLCAALFETYCPYDLNRCPYFLLVCWNPHSHLDPVPSKTPRTLIHIFNQLLDGLGWKLADATPRRIILDSAFMNGLQKALGWKGQRDPTLSDLHPSLGNADHAARLINNLQETYYPYGTGLKGAYHLLEEHKQLSCEDAYVRCVKEHDIPGEGSFRFVICMFKAMSELLVATKHPSIDTSFKRLHKWQEFEIEAWFSEYLRSIVVTRAFTTSQSAAAHHILFHCIFAIVHEDTGKVVQLHHIHGVGFDTFMADGHKGQALGLGLCCEEICRNMAGYCSIEWSKALHSLTPYEHLARMYRYCFSHFTRNVHGLRAHVSANVRGAMMSIASAEPLPDFKGTLKLIRSGGKKAIGNLFFFNSGNWLKDKESSSGFALAALYQPASKIPIDVWKASPSTSNGNEQAHHSVNHDGVKLTMLAGIMRGMQYDSRAMAGLEVLRAHGIYSRDQKPTHFRHATRTIVRSSLVQKRAINNIDTEVQKTYKKLIGLQDTVQTHATTLKHAIEMGLDVDQVSKKITQN